MWLAKHDVDKYRGSECAIAAAQDSAVEFRLPVEQDVGVYRQSRCGVWRAALER